MKKWTMETALLALGDMAFPDQKIVFLGGKGTLSQCSAADYLCGQHGFWAV